MRWLLIAVCCLLFAHAAVAEDVVRESFDDHSIKEPLVHSWGDQPVRVVANAVVPETGPNGSAAACLELEFPQEVPHNLSYWTYDLAERVPLVPELESISFQVKTNLPVSIKIAIWPYGFIFHGPGVAPLDQWQKVLLSGAHEKLKKWCEGGNRTAEGGWVSGVILAVGGTKGAKAEVIVDDLVIEGPAGAAKAVADEAFKRRTKKVRVAPISLVWDQGHRTLENVLLSLDEAGLAGADLSCLPECCVNRSAEPIPGSTSGAIAAKAAQYGMYVVGNLRELDGVLRRRGARMIVWSTSPFPIRDEHTITLALQGRATDNRVYYAVARYAGREGYGGYADRFSWTATWPLGRAQVFDSGGHTQAHPSFAPTTTR